MVDIVNPMSQCLCQRKAENNLLAHTGDTVITALAPIFLISDPCAVAAEPLETPTVVRSLLEIAGTSKK